jgi:putative spermidine/putrescine transport system ATP-binding protein
MSEVGASAGAMMLVSFRGVQKSYDGENLIVKDLNLDIRKGEFLTLLGPVRFGQNHQPDDAGGLRNADRRRDPAGRALDQQCAAAQARHRHGVSELCAVPAHDGGRKPGFPLTVRGLSRTDVSERVKRVLSMVQLDAFAQRYPAQLSGGQQQRVALARALVFEPQLVLMDEPLGALDKQLREHMQMEIKHLHQRLGVTVVYVTHDQGEALTMSDRVAVFHQGEIQQIAPPRTAV